MRLKTRGGRGGGDHHKRGKSRKIGKGGQVSRVAGLELPVTLSMSCFSYV